MSESTNYPNDKTKFFGLRDKGDRLQLTQVSPYTPQSILVEHMLTVDTRSCVGTQSLQDKAYAISQGIRAPASGYILNVTSLGITPITITFDSVSQLKNGDNVFIKGVQGNSAVDGDNVISNINISTNTADVLGQPNGYYKSSGATWYRQADSRLSNN